VRQGSGELDDIGSELFVRRFKSSGVTPTAEASRRPALVSVKKRWFEKEDRRNAADFAALNLAKIE
jgi:hypothetical protein